jgi:hypothetical protein
VTLAPPTAGTPTIVLERLPDAPHEPDSVVDAPLVGFDAFLADHRLYGWIRLTADRLTDLLNAHSELALDNVTLECLSDGRVEWHERLLVDRRRLIAVRAGGPRGDQALRQLTRPHPLVVQSGSYLIGGYLHARPGVEPLEELESRPVMVPLSMGWLEFWADGRRRHYWVGTIIFSRTLADAIEVVPEEALEFGATEHPIRAGVGLGAAYDGLPGHSTPAHGS